MAETFYGVLGVADDADAETIRRAYRERVKEHHPDVSDDPDAPEQFKRLTTARDVLVDADERTRYERLGHESYVSQFVDSPAWSGTSTTDTGPETRRDPTGRATEGADDSGCDRTAWLGEDGPGKRQQRGRQRRRQRRQQAHTAGAATATEEWQHASQTYQRADTDTGLSQTSPVRTLLVGLKSVGPWLFVHLIFVGSAVATSWLAFSQLATDVGVSWPTFLLGVTLVGMVVFVSVLHLISQVYS